MDWTAVLAGGGVTAAGLAAVGGAYRFATRPAVELSVDDDRVHSRVEADGAVYVRILASNSRFRRAARGARILVHSYRSVSDTMDDRVTLGSPSLGWPSAPDAVADGSLTLAPGVTRPLDLGSIFQPASLAYVMDTGHNEPPPPWRFKLGLHAITIGDQRDQLEPGHWIIRLVATASDAPARTFDVRLTWAHNAASAADVLASVGVSVQRI